MATLRLGPLLGYEWNPAEQRGYYTVTIATDAAGQPGWTVDGLAVPMVKIGRALSFDIWRGEIPAGGGGPPFLPVAKKGRAVPYEITLAGGAMKDRLGGSRWEFHLPAGDERPRVGFMSCNGFSDPALMTRVDPSAMWEKFWSEHQKKDADCGPFALLLMGGDQVYCDAVLHLDGLFTSWWNLFDRKDMKTYQPTAAELRELDDFYAGVYLNSWGGRDASGAIAQARARDSWPEPMMRAMASIPTVMMWDDHDVFDGWGSYADGRQNWPVYRAIYAAARKYFALFQIRSDARNRSLLRAGAARKTGDHFTLGLRLGSFLVLALDVRSERTPTRLLNDAHWDDVTAWMQRELDARGTAGEKISLLVVTGVPVVWRRFNALARNFPGLQDDALDHWSDHDHEGERDKLIHHLFAWGEHPATDRIVLLAGDVHVGGLGVLEDLTGERRQHEIVQVVSSAIVHPAPKAFEWLGILAGSDGSAYRIRGQDIEAKLIRPAGASEDILVTRNFAWLKPGTDGKLWINWVCEDAEKIGRPVHALPAAPPPKP